MFRLMFALFAFTWSAMLDTAGGGSGGSGDGGGSSGGGEGGGGSGGSPGGGPETFSLTGTELTRRTTAAAEAETKRIADLLGIDPDKIGDAKGLIEAGRARQNAENGGQGDGEGSGVDALLDTLEKLENRLQNMETAEETRQRHAAERTRDEKLTEALKGANVREDRMDAALTIALANGAKLDDKGELTGSKEAIEATKKALPEAFRGDGDTGRAADASGREGTERKPKTLTEALTAHYSKS